MRPIGKPRVFIAVTIIDGVNICCGGIPLTTDAAMGVLITNNGHAIICVPNRGDDDQHNGIDDAR